MQQNKYPLISEIEVSPIQRLALKAVMDEIPEQDFKDPIFGRLALKQSRVPISKVANQVIHLLPLQSLIYQIRLEENYYGIKEFGAPLVRFDYDKDEIVVFAFDVKIVVENSK